MPNVYLNPIISATVLIYIWKYFAISKEKKYISPMIRIFLSYKAISAYQSTLQQRSLIMYFIFLQILSGKKNTNFLEKSARTLISALKPVFQMRDAIFFTQNDSNTLGILNLTYFFDIVITVKNIISSPQNIIAESEIPKLFGQFKPDIINE